MSGRPRRINPRKGIERRRARNAAQRAKNAQMKSVAKKTMVGLAETKFKIVTTGATPYQPYNTFVAGISPYDMAQNLTENSRIGNVIQPTSLTINFTAYRGLSDCHLRVLVFRYNDRVSTGTLGPGNVLDSTNSGNLCVINAQKNPVRSVAKQSNILFDRTYILDDATQNGVSRKIVLNLMAQKILYEATGTGGVMNKDIVVNFFADTTLVNAPNVTYDMVARFKDI